MGHHASSIIHRSSVIIHHSSSIIHRVSFLIHYPSLVVHRLLIHGQPKTSASATRALTFFLGGSFSLFWVFPLGQSNASANAEQALPPTFLGGEVFSWFV